MRIRAFAFLALHFYRGGSDFSVLRMCCLRRSEERFIGSDAQVFGLFCRDLLVHGVLDVLLQPSDLWVQAHLSVALQPGTDRFKKKQKQHKLLSGVIYCRMKG